MRKEITIEDIKAWNKQLEEAGIKSRTTFNKPVGYIGHGFYRISDGCFVDKNGWDAFEKELLKQGVATMKKYKNKKK